MDPITNPFSPGAGAPPPALVGRDALLENARILLGRIKIKRPEKSLFLTGLRGVGKTVLLNEIERMAKATGYQTLLLEAQEDQSLGDLIYPSLRNLLYELNRCAGTGDKVKRALGVLRAFIGCIKLGVSDVAPGLDIEPLIGTADSGCLELDLSNLFVAIGEAAEERQTAVAVLIDEVQYLSQKELGAIITAMHRMQQRRLPIVFIAAGLPMLPGIVGNPKSYAERLFNFPEIGALSAEDVCRALRDPAKGMGVVFEEAALAEVFRVTQGHPYFVQEWGYQTWNQAAVGPITLQTILDATPHVTARLDRNFFRVRFDRLSAGEKNYLRAMASLGTGNYRTGDIAAALGTTVAGTSPVRAKLIKKGLIYSPEHGEMAFTVPMFGEFMVRAIPAFTPGKCATRRRVS